MIEELLSSTIDWGERILWAIIFLIIALIIARLLMLLIHRLLQRTGTDELFSKFISRITGILIFSLILILILDWLGINTSYLVAILVAILLAIGLGLQDSLANIAATMRIFLYQPFHAGDQVNIDGKEGYIEEINLMNTNLRTSDNTKIFLPNAAVAKATIINYYAWDSRRIDIVIRVDYEEDLEKVRTLLMAVLQADENVLDDPPPTVSVKELGETAVHLLVRPWVESDIYSQVQRDLYEKIKVEFNKEGISIPYPQLEIHQRQ